MRDPLAAVGGQRDCLSPPLLPTAPKDPLFPIAIKKDEWYNDSVREDPVNKIQD